MSDEGIKILAAIGNPGTTDADTKAVVFYRLPEEQLSRKEAAGVLATVAGIFPTSTLMIGFAEGDKPGTYWVGLNHLLWGKAFEQALIALELRGVSKKLSLPGPNPNPTLKRLVIPSWLAPKASRSRALFDRLKPKGSKKK